jgi:hypothetical protein
MSTEEARQITQAIMAAVRNHEPQGLVQWYTDELCIDCDAEEFWDVVEQALTDLDRS